MHVTISDILDILVISEWLGISRRWYYDLFLPGGLYTATSPIPVKNDFSNTILILVKRQISQDSNSALFSSTSLSCKFTVIVIFFVIILITLTAIAIIVLYLKPVTAFPQQKILMCPSSLVNINLLRKISYCWYIIFSANYHLTTWGVFAKMISVWFIMCNSVDCWCIERRQDQWRHLQTHM